MNIIKILSATAALSFCLLAFLPGESRAQSYENGWYPYVFAREQDRAWLESTPIQMRPNRPLHVYGNVVRRNQYYGPMITNPAPRIAVRSTRGIVRRGR